MKTNVKCRDATRLPMDVSEEEDNIAEVCGINSEMPCDVSTIFTTYCFVKINEEEKDNVGTCCRISLAITIS